MTDHPITPPPPHLLKKFSTQARHEADKRNGPGYLKTFATLCIEWAMNLQPTPNDRQIRSSEIEPPPELLEQWEAETAHTAKDESWHVAVQAARWGADQELQACCDWLSSDITTAPAVEYLYADRRPKPPSLKEKALQGLEYSLQGGYITPFVADNIRRALEQLDD